MLNSSSFLENISVSSSSCLIISTSSSDVISINSKEDTILVFRLLIGSTISFISLISFKTLSAFLLSFQKSGLLVSKSSFFNFSFLLSMSKWPP